MDMGGRKNEGKTHQIFKMAAITRSTRHIAEIFGIRLTLAVPLPLQVAHQLIILSEFQVNQRFLHVVILGQILLRLGV